MDIQRVSNRPLLIAVAAVSTALATQTTLEASSGWSVIGKNIADLTTAYETGLTTATDVVGQYLNRINAYNGGHLTGINAVASINPNVMAEAASVDALIASGATTSQYPLLGVPVLVKNSFDVGGMVTTNGLSILNGVGPISTNLVAPDDAWNVARLKSQGAIILGKASMSTMAYSYNGIDNDRGVVLNPVNPRRHPGGSSSGSGAAIAAEFAMLTMGGETGGSIRVPANANGIVGLKPTNGLINAEGTWPLNSIRDVVGPMGKSVVDIAYAMNALVAPSSNNIFDNTPYYPNPAQPAGSVRPADYRDYLDANAFQGKVVAVPNKYYLNNNNVAPTVRNAFDEALDVMRSLGATVVFVNTPTYSTAGTTGTWLNNANAHYYNELIKSYNDPIIKDIYDLAGALEAGAAAQAGFHSFSSLTSAGNNIRAHANRITDIINSGIDPSFASADVQAALQAIVNLRQTAWSDFMANPNLPDDPNTPFDESTITKIDVFSFPTFGGVATAASAAIRTALGLDAPTTYSGGGSIGLLGRDEGNLFGAPALAVPMGFTSDGTPMGLQFMGDFLKDHELLGYGYAYELVTNWYSTPDLSFVPEPTAIAGVLVLSVVFLRRTRRAAAVCNSA